VIVDAGAHIGCFSLLAARRFPGVPIEAFEPSASNHRLLEFNLRGNGVAQARAHHAALSNREGEARLAPASSMGGRVSDESGEVIRLVRLSRVVPMAPGARLLMKLDVEGSEWDVLEEATPVFPADTMLFVETHAGAADRGRIAEYARVNGFTVRHTNDKDGYDEWVLTRGAWGAPQGDAS
jgi:FkbM family methyltransferase